MNQEIVAEERFDILGNLPREICYKILFYLAPNDIANSFRCCKKWQQHINYKFVWKKLDQSAYIDTKEEPKTKIYHKMVQSYSVHGQGHNMYYRALKYNVKNEKYQLLRININTSENDLRFVYMDDRITILGTEYKFFFINSTCGLVERTIKFNEYYYRMMGHFNGNYIVAVSKYCDVKVWNVKDGTVITNMNLKCCGGIVAIVSCKHLIILININDVVFILDARTRECRVISEARYACCSKNLAAFLLQNGNIIIRDSDYHCVTSLNCSDLYRENRSIDTMTMNRDFLVIEEYERRTSRLLSIFNIKTKENFNISILSNRSSYFKISNNRLVFRTEGRSFEIWDMCTQNCLFKIGFENNILSLKLHDSYIYVGLRSPKLKWQMWCLQTGKFVHEFSFYSRSKEEIIAITNSKLLYRCPGMYGAWEIRDFEANLFQKKTKKIRKFFNKKEVDSSNDVYNVIF